MIQFLQLFGCEISRDYGDANIDASDIGQKAEVV